MTSSVLSLSEPLIVQSFEDVTACFRTTFTATPKGETVCLLTRDLPVTILTDILSQLHSLGASAPPQDLDIIPQPF